MIVCSCHAVRESSYLRACRSAQKLGRPVEDLCPAGTCCGGCLPTLLQIREELRYRSGQAVPSRCALALLSPKPDNPALTKID